MEEIDKPFTQEEMIREFNRFHMACSHCGLKAIPQLMPLDPIVYIKLFIQQHSRCYPKND